MKYYKENLDRLGKIHRHDSIKILCNGKETNYFAINEESKEALKNWIDKL